MGDGMALTGGAGVPSIPANTISGSSLSSAGNAGNPFLMPGGNMPPDSFTPAESKKKEPKGKYPKWLTWTAELAVPIVSLAVFHKLPLGLSKKARGISGALVAGASTGGLDYWRQKNNDGKVNWGSWAFNTAMGGLPELLLLKIKTPKLDLLEAAASHEKTK
jgi:hypothetical protein